MQARWLRETGHRDLLVIFGGWGIGHAPLALPQGADDRVFLDDYRTLDLPASVAARLQQAAGQGRVSLLAFSFGVVSAAHWLAAHLAAGGARPDRLVAVAGTLWPADPARGIAPERIAATGEMISDQGLGPFCRRAGWAGPVPDITGEGHAEALRSELRAITRRGAAPDPGFDRIWLPARDRIIPIRAQEAAWAGQGARLRRCAGGHVPFDAGQDWAEWLA